MTQKGEQVSEKVLDVADDSPLFLSSEAFCIASPRPRQPCS